MRLPSMPGAASIEKSTPLVDPSVLSRSSPIDAFDFEFLFFDVIENKSDCLRNIVALHSDIDMGTTVNDVWGHRIRSLHGGF